MSYYGHLESGSPYHVRYMPSLDELKKERGECGLLMSDILYMGPRRLLALSEGDKELFQSTLFSKKSSLELLKEVTTLGQRLSKQLNAAPELSKRYSLLLAWNT